MNENTPDTIGNKETPTDIILYLRSIKKEINELDNNIIVIFKDEYNNKVGKMEYTKFKSKLQGDVKILTSYDFSSIQEELNKYETSKAPITVIDSYIQTLI
jgi:actin-like ATPase involved in cell morphogenesis